MILSTAGAASAPRPVFTSVRRLMADDDFFMCCEPPCEPQPFTVLPRPHPEEGAPFETIASLAPHGEARPSRRMSAASWFETRPAGAPHHEADRGRAPS